MHHKILEIIEFLISELDDSKESLQPDIDQLSQKLLEKGYTENDIQKAVDWIVDYVNRSKNFEEFPEAGERGGLRLRLLTPIERKIFSREAQGLLVQFQQLGILKPAQVEQIIDRCFMFGLDRVEVEDIKLILMQVLLGKESPSINGKPLFFPIKDTVH